MKEKIAFLFFFRRVNRLRRRLKRPFLVFGSLYRGTFQNRLRIEHAARVMLGKTQHLSTPAKMELGKRISEIPKADNGGANQYQAQSTAVSTKQKPKSETIAELGLTQKQAERFQQMAQNPDAVQAAMTGLIFNASTERS